MTTLRQIVTDAYREQATTQMGETPDADQLDEGFRKLTAIIRSLTGNEMGEPLISVSYGSPATGNAYVKDYDNQSSIDSYMLRSNTRLTVHKPEASTVYLDPQPDDGARIVIIDGQSNFATNNFTVHANGNKINGGDFFVIDTDGYIAEFFYRRDIGEWMQVEPLTLGSQSPFPVEFDDYLSILTAVRLFPRYQQSMAAETAMYLRRLERNFKSRYRQTREVGPDEALVRITAKGGRTYQEELYRFNQGRID